ncbi:MAG: cob(I)yrinic acid a,c-diamide adenosyltransferase [Lachnospiraceae bacterium]
MKGLIHIYEGDGKGKTSTAVGLAVRCAGNGEKVVFTQFLKDNTSGELSILAHLEMVTFLPAEQSFGFYFNMTEEQKREAELFYRRHFEQAVACALNNQCRLLVLDELMAAVNCNLVEKNRVIEFLKEKPEEMEVVMTGRDPAVEFINLADYVSKIVKIKHPFDQGIGARKGIEY